MGRLRARPDCAVSAQLTDGAGNSAYALPRGVIVVLGLACAVVVVAGLRSESDILVPVFLALTLTVTRFADLHADVARTLGAGRTAAAIRTG